MTDFLFSGSKIPLDGDCSHEIKRHLLLKGNLWQPRQHIKKQRYHFDDSGPYSQSYGFSSSHVWMLGQKKAEHRADAFKVWHSRRLLRVPWTIRRFNQSILKEINTEYSLEGLMLKLKLWYFGHLIWRADSLEKTLRLGKIEGKRRRAWRRMKWLDSISDSMDKNLNLVSVDWENALWQKKEKLRKANSQMKDIAKDRGARQELQRIRRDLATEQQQRSANYSPQAKSSWQPVS